MKIETAIKTFGAGYAVKVTVTERNAEPQTIINYAAPTLASAIDAAMAALRDLRPADAAPQAGKTAVDYYREQKENPYWR